RLHRLVRRAFSRIHRSFLYLVDSTRTFNGHDAQRGSDQLLLRPWRTATSRDDPARCASSRSSSSICAPTRKVAEETKTYHERKSRTVRLPTALLKSATVVTQSLKSSDATIQTTITSSDPTLAQRFSGRSDGPNRITAPTTNMSKNAATNQRPTPSRT